jgi:hypothetical protein
VPKALKLSIPDNIELADNNFYRCGKIDTLIGADTYWDIMSTNTFKLILSGQCLQETKLG